MELEEVNAKHDAIKKKYWKPEWNSMSEEEKFKEPQYIQYIYEKIVLNLEHATEKIKNASPDPFDEDAVSESTLWVYEKTGWEL